ncbi:MAG: nuclear transport factor 2 family protein [Anaerolineales bacterium]|nr:nuclear transport factor 2 family protein [Anaerolineales bacterium]
MAKNDTALAVRQTLRQFQEGYTARDTSALDNFMQLFSRRGDVEMIGIGATTRGGSEWFRGPDQVREIVDSDWRFWGEVQLDVDEAQISVSGNTAWISTSGQLLQNQAFNEAMAFYVSQMKDLLEEEGADPDTRMMEATHFGLRRLRERHKGEGHAWPLVLTAVLIMEQGNWRFHTIHWSMPVD